MKANNLLKQLLKCGAFTFLLYSLPVFSETFKPAGKDDVSCPKLSPSDKYETPTRIGEDSKLYANQCIDTNRFRPAVIIENNKSMISFANYQHNDKFWIATISKDIVIEKVFFQIVRFDIVSGVTAAHTQLRVRLAPGHKIQLRSQSDNSITSVNDLVISFEASRPQNVPYNFARGVIDNYLSVARVLSGNQRLRENTENKTEQYEINLPQQDRLTMILRAIDQSHIQKFSRFYNTLKPNCTTDVFDLIDALPSQVGKKHEPFLTVISNDPVAGPSLKGLAERKLLVNECPSFLHDEVVMGKKDEINCSFAPQASELKLLSEIEGFPYSLVMSLDTKTNSAEVIKKAKSLAYQLAPQIAQRLGSSLMLANSDATFSLLGSLNSLSPLIRKQLELINNDLNSDPISLSLYLAPWDESGIEVTNVLKEMGVSAKLPFKTFETNYTDLDSLQDGFAIAAQAKAQEKQSFGLLGIAINLKLVKDTSMINLQIVGHLGPQEKELPNPITSAQADITNFVIPSANYSFMQPLALLEFSQSLQNKSPKFQVEFGPFSGIYNNPDDTPKATLLGSINVNPTKCQIQSYSVPRMEGKIAIPRFNFLGKWKSANFHITKVEFDLEKQIASNVSVDVKPVAFVCLENQEQASAEFKKGINEQINQTRSEKASLGSSLGLSILNSIFANNKEGIISGF